MAHKKYFDFFILLKGRNEAGILCGNKNFSYF